MGASALVLERTDLSEDPSMASLLASEGLPTDDLQDEGRTFYRIIIDKTPVGFVGMEGEGDNLLLRSLVIDPARRSAGIGQRAVRAIEAKARANGACCLHLLTNTAADFFRRNGYQDRKREEAPQAVIRSREFSELCPASASYLVKKL